MLCTTSQAPQGAICKSLSLSLSLIYIYIYIYGRTGELVPGVFAMCQASVFFAAVLRDLRRNIDSKSFIDIRVYFLLFPEAFNRDLKRNKDHKSSVNLLVYFLKLVIDIQEGI